MWCNSDKALKTIIQAENFLSVDVYEKSAGSYSNREKQRGGREIAQRKFLNHSFPLNHTQFSLFLFSLPLYSC